MTRKYTYLFYVDFSITVYERNSLIVNSNSPIIHYFTSMPLLATITDADFGSQPVDSSNFRRRQAVRAVLFDENGEIAVLYVAKEMYHKLPGGGVEAGESLTSALTRECLEEAGSRPEIESEIGSVIEIRGQEKLVQESVCYLARVKGERRAPKFTEDEKANQFSLRFMSIDDALEKLKSDKPQSYNGRFIQKRDSAFLAAVAAML
ncbi:TPA: ADP-ribose pyrophosphatase [Candidatus Falkowbacteria bacterium]|nr:ADP-ribose pyrophosphatase [Candidatus Falkowbacteria bacterium]